MRTDPTISVLITTFNRRDLLKRAVDSVLNQDLKDLELVIIDDCSTDGTQETIPDDSRIRYIRNEVNQGAEHGDRVHVKRFVNELAKGKYFAYLCDDDFWVDGLLSKQMKIFNTYPNVSMIIGGQRSDYAGVLSNGKTFSKFHENIYPKKMMTSDQFLQHFAEHPVECNIVVGGTLFNLDLFRQSGAMSLEDGPKWQAGPEFFMGPGSMGNVGYIDEPCVIVDVRAGNASFRGTQLEHYLDWVKSVKTAFSFKKGEYYENLKWKTIENIGKAYLANAETIKVDGKLTMCSPENIARPVTTMDLIYA